MHFYNENTKKEKNPSNPSWAEIYAKKIHQAVKLEGKATGL